MKVLFLIMWMMLLWRCVLFVKWVLFFWWMILVWVIYCFVICNSCYWFSLRLINFLFVIWLKIVMMWWLFGWLLYWVRCLVCMLLLKVLKFKYNMFFLLNMDVMCFRVICLVIFCLKFNFLLNWKIYLFKKY